MSETDVHILGTEDIARYMGTIYEPGDVFEIRAIRRRKTGEPRTRDAKSVRIHEEYDPENFSDHSEIKGVMGAALTNMHHPRYSGVYACVNPLVDRPQRIDGTHFAQDHHIRFARCLYVDIDDRSPSDALKSVVAADLPDPTLVINSGRRTGTHMYWRLAEAISDLELFSRLQKALIEALKADKSVHNPSRVMRLPGTYNFKQDNSCRILRVGPRYDSWHDLHIEPVVEAVYSQAIDASELPPDEANLGYTCRTYLNEPTSPGERNQKLFAAAADFAGNNFDFDVAYDRLIKLATERDGLPQHEAARVIRNAFKKARGPARVGEVVWFNEPIEHVLRDLDEDSVQTDLEKIVTFEDLNPEMTVRPERILPRTGTSGPGEQFTQDPNETVDGDDDYAAEEFPVVANYISTSVYDQTKRKHIEIRNYKSGTQLISEVNESLAGWPKIAPGIGLFGYRLDDEGYKEMLPLPSPTSLFAWLHGTDVKIQWETSKVYDKHNEEIIPISKAEFFDVLSQQAKSRYRGFAETPHEPLISSFYYPERPLPDPSEDFIVLRTLLDKLNPETEIDRWLLLAAIITPGWGGPPGARPLFLLSSDFGQGSGKTETVKVIASIWGGYADMSPEMSWADNSKRLMSSNEWQSRILLFDNVKGKFEGQALESAVTSSTINGHRMYHGSVSRYNDATFFVTYNDPELSRDISERAVIIKIGRPKTDADFAYWWPGFIEEYRWQLVADCLAILSRVRDPEAVSAATGGRGDRWGLWRSEVVSRLHGLDVGLDAPNVIDAALALSSTATRRREADEETNTGEDLLHIVAHYLQTTGRGRDVQKHTGGRLLVSKFELLRLMVAAGVFDDRIGGSHRRKVSQCFRFVWKHLSPAQVMVKPEGRCRARVDSKGVPKRYIEGATEAPEDKQADCFEWDWRKLPDDFKVDPLLVEGDSVLGIDDMV